MLRQRLALPAVALLLFTIVFAVACSKDKSPTATKGGSKELGDTLIAGAIFKHRFAIEGTYPYHCNFHPSMQGSVIVSASATPTDSAVNITNYVFTPATVTIPVGWTVTWTNTALDQKHSDNSD